MPRRPAKQKPVAPTMDFSALVDAIQQVHEHSTGFAKRAVNLSLTLRNWVIGWYVREYEQNGSDRAAYGEALLERLSKQLTTSVSHQSLRAIYVFVANSPPPTRESGGH